MEPGGLDRCVVCQVTCVTTGLDGDSLYETTFTKKAILVIGSEAHGVSNELMQLATKKITIPLAAACESSE